MHRRPASRVLPALALFGALVPAGACVDRDKSEPPAAAQAPVAPRRTCVELPPPQHGDTPGDRELYGRCIESARATAATVCDSKLALDSRDVPSQTTSQQCVVQWLDGLPGSECTTTTPTSATDWVSEVETWPPFAGLGHRCAQLAASEPKQRTFLPSCDPARKYLTCLRARHDVEVGACDEQAASGEASKTPDGRPIDCYELGRFGAPALSRTTHTEDASGARDVTTTYRAQLDWRWNVTCLDDLWHTLVNCLE